MGGSLYELYVNEIINPQLPLDKQVEVLSTRNRLSAPNKLKLYNNQPVIFYGESGGTHYTGTVDGIRIWDPYYNGIQEHHTDHFCQTFTLMYIINNVLPDSQVGEAFENLKNGKFTDNVIIAINVACDIIQLLLSTADPDIKKQTEDYIDEAVDENSVHILNQKFGQMPPDKLGISLIAYCRNITKEELCNSSFKNKIYKDSRTICN